MHPQGLIFDCDGTLADSMPLHWIAWSTVSKRHGFSFPKDRFYSFGGVPSRDIVKMLAREQGLPLDPIAISKEKEAIYEPLMEQIKPIECVVRVVRENHGIIPMAVASGGTKWAINRVLEILGIRSYFDAVVTNEAVVHQKPAPDIFLEAARRIGVKPELCRGYEDTDLGLTGIRAAGMEAVDVRLLRQKPNF